MNSTRIKLIIAGVILALVVTATIYTLYMNTERAGKVAVQIDFVPTDSNVTINGERLSRGTAYLAPGEYHVRGDKDGFSSFEQTFLVNEARAIIALSLQPISDEAKEWAERHEKDYGRIDSHGAQLARLSGKFFHEQNPIARHLPYRSLIYSIGYKADPTDPINRGIIIVIDAPEPYRQAALNKIRNLGFDPTDFTIEFLNYENPFPL